MSPRYAVRILSHLDNVRHAACYSRISICAPSVSTKNLHVILGDMQSLRIHEDEVRALWYRAGSAVSSVSRILILGFARAGDRLTMADPAGQAA